MGGADLIFCGKQAIDGDTAQVGPMLATILGIPYVAWARKLAFGDGGKLTVERLLDHGYDAVEMSLPGPGHRGQGDQRAPGAVLQGQAQSQERGHPGVGDRRLGMAAADVGLSGSFTQVVKVFPPPARGNRKSGPAPPRNWPARLWQRLKEQSKAQL